MPSPSKASLRFTTGSLATTRKRTSGVLTSSPRLSFHTPEPMQLWPERSFGVVGLPEA